MSEYTPPESVKSEMYWIHPDHFSGASILVNSGGNVTNWYEYMPYGEMLMENTTFNYDNPNKYNAKEYDMATGYYFYGARYYDPKRSFWLSVDPLSEITNSPYAYVWNDPVNFVDPTGMMGERAGGEGPGPKVIKDCFGGGDHGQDPFPKHMRTAAIRIAAEGLNSVGRGDVRTDADKTMNDLWLNYVSSHNLNFDQMAKLRNEINTQYKGLVLVKGWHKETYNRLYNVVIRNMKLNHDGVQYAVEKAILEAENNWAVLEMGSEVAAAIAAEGLFPTNVSKIKPRKPYSAAKNYQKIANSGFSKIVDGAKQGKHIVGHNNYIGGKSILTENAQGLLDAFHAGNVSSTQIINSVKIRVDFGKNIGNYVKDGVAIPTNKGIIINAKRGVHIVPSAP
ncbi:MAG: polymorphic toxin type 50 domain-containing protein [Chryseobacterium sp.]